MGWAATAFPPYHASHYSYIAFRDSHAAFNGTVTRPAHLNQETSYTLKEDVMLEFCFLFLH